MANDRPEMEHTDLIDVSDVEAHFDDDFASVTDKGRLSEPIPGLAPSEEMRGPTIASLKDRFAAFLIDSAFLYVIYWLMMISYRKVSFGSAAGPVPAAGMNGLIFHALFLLIALLWFSVPELALCASLGKKLCHLVVRKTDGTYAGFLAVLIRNIVRPIDMVLFPLLVGAAMMEWTKWQQRLGDLLGRTVVLKNYSTPPRQYALSLDIVASTTRRMLAFMVDLSLAGAFAFGLALTLSPDAPLASMLTVVMAPPAVAAFFILPEWLTKTSPGKWLFGLTICQEDGSAVDLPSSTIRTSWRLFDTNPFGFLTSLFSVRRQRPGDSAAGTVVIMASRELRGAIGLAIAVLVSISTLYGGLDNRDSFLHEDFQVNFLPSIEFRNLAAGAKGPVPQSNLMIKNFHFAAGDAASVRSPSIFEPGETLFLVFEVDNYQRDGAKVWLQEDLSVRYPDDSVGLKLENINDFNQELAQSGPIRFENNVAIPQNAQSGRYTIVLTVRDKLSRQELKEQRFFYVTPSESSPSSAPAQVPSGAPKIEPNKPPDSGADFGTGGSGVPRGATPPPNAGTD